MRTGNSGAARIATLVAVPVALLAGVLAFQALRPPPHGAPRPAATGPVAMPVTPLAARPAALCRALFSALPDRLGSLARRPVTDDAGQNAAYGDPPVTVACGTAGPSAPPGADYLRLDGICWYPEAGPDATVWSLVGREVPARVTVPNAHQGELLVGLSAAVRTAVPVTIDPCT